MSISLKFLGEFTACDGDGASLSLPTRKTWALLGYLAVHADRLQSRERLMALLWSDRDERQARQSLNHALLSIRKLDRSGDPPLLESSGEQVTLRSDALDIDISRFRALLTEQPVAAAALYDGPLFGDLSIPDPVFEEWLTVARSDFHALACEALERAIESDANDSGTDAIDAARQLVRLDPVRESGHQHLMRLLYERGDRASALRQYDECAAILEKELTVEPGATTKALYEAIRRDGSANGAAIGPASAPITPPSAAAIAPLRKPDRKRFRRAAMAAAASAAIGFAVGIAVLYQDSRHAEPDAIKSAAVTTPNAAVDQGRAAALDAEWRQALRSELKDAVTLASRQVMETARNQAAEVVKRAQEVATTQADAIIARAKEDAHSRAAEIVAQARKDAKAQSAEIVAQTKKVGQAQAAEIVERAQRVAQAQAAQILARAQEQARETTETAARALARKTKELAGLEREYRRRIAQAAPIPRSKPASGKSPANTPIAAAKPILRPGWKVDLEKDRQAIERAITDHYFVSNNWGEIHQIRNIRFHEIQGDQVEMTVEYVVASMSTAGWRGFTKRSLQGRFLLRKEGGSFAVLKMWDTKENDLRASSERKPESRAPSTTTARKRDAGTTKPNAERTRSPITPSSIETIDYTKDRTAIEQAIIDFYFLAHHQLYEKYSTLEIHDLSRLTVHRIDGDEIDVSAEYLASSSFWTSPAPRLHRQSRFLLRKENGAFIVLRMWDTRESTTHAASQRIPESRLPKVLTARKDDTGSAKPNVETLPVRPPTFSGSTIDYEKDRAAIELAISDFYFLTGHLDEDADYANDNYYGSEIFDFRSVTVQKIDGNEVDVLVEFLAAADSNYGAVSLERKSRFLLRKNKESFTVLKMWKAGAV